MAAFSHWVPPWIAFPPWSSPVAGDTPPIIDWEESMIKIVVCVKAVPDPKEACKIKIDPDTKTLLRVEHGTTGGR